MTDDPVSGGENSPCGTVVFFKPKDLAVGIVLLEIQYVPDVGSPECVDALRVVTYDADVAVMTGKLPEKEILDSVGILVLIDKDVPEPVLVPFQDVLVAGEQLERLQEEIVEVHRVGLLQPPLIFLIDKGGLLRHWIGALLPVRLRRDHGVLRKADA